MTEQRREPKVIKPEDVDAMVAECRSGPRHARVDNVVSEPAAAPEMPGFRVLPGG